ncbi:hypothetical protein COX74_03480 [bacterium (Candidatus Gribaldobacteria) CG_4_10_14_0_2_um_filter_41_16]|uniref:Uncharacterized protein n=4 Tax=Candidatus Gribaldobacteria TaxID=2798536 RepID=A0A2M7VHG7_9BACT|nr:MAG: hypothetical protein COS21_01290 [bacterium (Candidatus Gribaldobacteria) CG02_land_8_20_14_3_00_41_15]PJA01210.1 MAG: hypothetical protein COX74_03480 [bacterium (Candidatus Gribaldobacteria) CG_4_10_14_0_2_um_filter_41_16]
MMKNIEPKMKMRFADDDWSSSFDELNEKENGLKSRLMEARRQLNILRSNASKNDLEQKSVIEKAQKAMQDYREALTEVELLIKQRKTGSA